MPATSAAGNSGRNTTIIRSNYGIPESVRFYQHSLEMYQRLEAETGCWIMHSQKGQIWLAHSVSDGAHRADPRADEPGVRRARPTTSSPTRSSGCCPQIDLTGGGRYPVHGRQLPPRRCHGPPRPGGVGLRPGRAARRCARVPAHAGHRPADATATASPACRPRTAPISAGTVHLGGRRQRQHGRRLGGRAAAHPHARVAGVRHQRLRAGVRADRVVATTSSSTSVRRRAGRC